ncbi:hypothetical protein L6452_10983 [Arctium lappa]|uniref:Uncharacterized protein n=1 Tax=Arctium lappa TaxID=4217 RepID=A0ACB9DNQ6_ARCLA|nr:hypothetical protein L6452_10983 [Arctium lappa]
MLRLEAENTEERKNGMAGDVHGRREGQKAWLWLGTLDKGRCKERRAGIVKPQEAAHSAMETSLQISQPYRAAMALRIAAAVAPGCVVDQRNNRRLFVDLELIVSYQTTSPVHNETVQQPNTGDRDSIFGSSDDNVIMKQVFDTHVPDDTDVDVKPLLHIVEDILKQATIHAGSTSTVLSFLMHQVHFSATLYYQLT